MYNERLHGELAAPRRKSPGPARATAQEFASSISANSAGLFPYFALAQQPFTTNFCQRARVDICTHCTCIHARIQASPVRVATARGQFEFASMRGRARVCVHAREWAILFFFRMFDVETGGLIFSAAKINTRGPAKRGKTRNSRN